MDLVILVNCGGYPYEIDFANSVFVNFDDACLIKAGSDRGSTSKLSNNVCFGKARRRWLRSKQPSIIEIDGEPDLRHTFAKSLLDPASYGVDCPPMPLPAIQHLLGHADIATTTIYTRVSADDLARMMGTSESL